MKPRRILVIVAAAGVILVASAYFLLTGQRFEISITNSDIQSRLDQLFPKTKTHLLVLRLTYQNPRAKLIEGADRIQIGLDAVLNIRLNREPRSFSGSVDVDTSISFNPESGEFFLIDPVIKNLAIGGIPQAYTGQANTLASEAAAEFMDRYPVYTLRATDVKTTIAKLVLKGVRVENGVLIVTLGV